MRLRNAPDAIVRRPRACLGFPVLGSTAPRPGLASDRVEGSGFRDDRRARGRGRRAPPTGPGPAARGLGSRDAGQPDGASDRRASRRRHSDGP